MAVLLVLQYPSISGRTIKAPEFQAYIQKNRNVMLLGSLFYQLCLFSNMMLTAF